MPPAESFIRIKPNVDGKLVLGELNTLEYIPSSKLDQGREYEVKILLDKIFTGVPGRLEVFSFPITVIEQDFRIDHQGLSPNDDQPNSDYSFTGQVVTADVTDLAAIDKIAEAQLGNQAMDIEWEMLQDRKLFAFRINNIPRGESESQLLIKWNGDPYGIERVSSDTVMIPSRGEFAITSVNVFNGDEQKVEIRLSDILDHEQILKGLIKLASNEDIRISVNRNIVSVYPHAHLSGSQTIQLHKGIRSEYGLILNQNYEYVVTFEDLKPAIKLLGRGVILPSSERTVLSFEAVNLNAVDITIIKIYENNIPQFLQVNQLDGIYQLTRVGKPVLKRKIPLGANDVSLRGNWKAYSADLSRMIEEDPGALYQVIISFKKAYSAYPCNSNAEQENAIELLEEYDLEKEFSNWDNYYNSYYYPPHFRWSERDDPCSDSYYYSSRWAITNILSSNLGIIAKGTDGNSMMFIVTDLQNATPLPGVDLNIYDYQHQKIESLKTDNKGFAEIKLEKKPYLLIASNGRNRGYLRLDDGTSLSLSKFNVGGMRVQEGLKGYIYGERGVWRPGDTLFLNFMLQDQKHVLPADHPVIFTLTNPQDQIIERMVSNEQVSGIYNFTVPTEQDALTGNWSVKIEVGGATFTRRVRIETVKPNRLKIDLDLGTDTVEAYKQTLKGMVSSKWLHGLPAAGLKADIEMKLNSYSVEAFKDYPEYTFYDPTRSFNEVSTLVFENTLDAEGMAVINKTIAKTERAPGLLNATFYTRVFERGGDFSYDYHKMVYAPFEHYVGIKTPEGDRWGRLLVDSTHSVDVVTVDIHGRPVAVKNLNVVIYKLRWRWWWNASDNDLASYYGDNFHDPVLKKTISTGRDGKASVDFSVPYPDWGRFLVYVSDPSGGHAAGKTVYVDWPDFAGRNLRGNAEGASMLVFSTDKETYQIGESVKVTFPSSGKGRVLMSLENGSDLLDAFWIEPQEKQTTFTFQATSEMSPNIYINLTYIQPYNQTANDLPIRLYGVRGIEVEDSTTRLRPVIEILGDARPEEKLSVRISESYGRSMGYTLAIVDEGLLDITRFKTPDPWSVFFAREALGVKTWDLFDYVIGAYSGQFPRLLAIGGDMDEGEDGESKVNRFKPVVRFFGPYYLEAGETAQISFTMPNYVGSVKAMVVASGENCYGSAHKIVSVKKPLMVLTTLPRVLGPGEQVKLPVNVFAMDESIDKVEVSVETSGVLEISGPAKGSLKFDKPGDKMISFDLATKDLIGIARSRVNVKSGNETAYQEIGLEVRNPNPIVRISEYMIIHAGEAKSFNLILPGMPGTNELIIEVSGQPSVDFGRRLKYLLDYPHGCAEQIVSRAFPQLLLENVMEVTPGMRILIDKHIIMAISDINKLQMSNGGLRYWPGQTMANDWVTSYAGNFMIEAKKKGYTLPYGFMEKWIKYQKRAANEWKRKVTDFRGYYYQSPLIQAYRLYTLALAGESQIGAMNRLNEEGGLDMLSNWRLAAAYAVAGQPEMARKISSKLDTSPENSYDFFSATYGSALRDQAMIMETLVILGEKEKAIPIMQMIADKLSSGQWYSTQTLAYSLVAVAQFVGENAKYKREFSFIIDTGNAEERKVSSDKPYYQMEIDPGEETRQKISFTNTTDNDLYLSTFSRGIPLTDTNKAISSNLSMNVEYISREKDQINIDKIEQGTDFYAKVTVYNPGHAGNITDLALTQIFPSGWEIINTRMMEDPIINEVSKPDYQDIRDDRVYTYFDLDVNKKRTFVVRLNAAYLGKFFLPAVSCEAMYNNHVTARNTGKWVEVVKPGTGQ